MIRLQWFLRIRSAFPFVLLLNVVLTSAIEPDSSFKDYFVTHPRVFHGREKRSVSSSSDFQEETGHIHNLIVELNLAGRNVTLDLQLNRNLIPKQYFEKYQKNGDYVIKKPNLNDEKTELCHYNGHVRNVPNSWVAVSTCDGIKGVVYDGNELHYVESTVPSSTDHSGIASLDGPHFIYRHSDLASNFSCGTHDPLPSGVGNTIHAASHRFKRNAPNIRGPYNANALSRYIELVLVIDHRFYIDYQEDVSKINRRCKDLANVINSLYEPLNIFVALTGVVIWTERDEISVMPDGDATLTNFLSYRKTLMRDHPNDNAQFLTSSAFEKNVVGKALKGPICTYEFSGGVNVDHNRLVGLVATTIAHEMGHNLGMEHDNDTDTSCKCPKERCIMAPSSSSQSPTDWSSCSQEYLALAFEHGMDYCLRNKPVSLFEGPVCGNSFVEDGEECDCGLPEKCTNNCCDPVTCKLRGNATCATGACCDLQTCTVRDPGTVCRSTDHECDLPEYCNGESEYCPEDIFKIDGLPCAGETAFCYQGNCRSHTGQCKILWGPSGSSSDPDCYKLNKQGSINGNCGYDRVKGTYEKCDEKDVECGMLQCKHATEKLQFGTESAANLSAYFITTDKLTIACRTAIIDLGLNDVDPGLTPDGAKCGKNHMCLNRKCVAIDSHRERTVPNACPDNCDGNGVCNSKGQCHCNNGYAPPKCDGSGPGGSLHSGPAENPRNYNKLRTVFWYVMLSLIPLVVVLLLYPHFARKSPTYFWKRNQRRTVLCEKTVHTKTVNVYANGTDGASGPRQSLVGAETKPKTGGDEQSHSSLQDSLLGNFKGFSIVPLTKNTSPAPLIASPSRPAPTSPPVAQPKFSPKIVRAAPTSPPSATIMQPPQLPPQNRPLISSPVLDNTTSIAAKELINKDTSVVRPAPAPPVTVGIGFTRINKQPSLAEPVSYAPEKPTMKEHSYVTLSRIASLISKSQPGVTPAVSKTVGEKRDGLVAQKAAKIDRDTLKKLKISDPIPLNEPTVETLPLSKAQEKGIVMRAQSMRQTKKTQRAAVHSFGSMRLPPGTSRPSSLVNCSRPSAPPPRPPSEAANQRNESATVGTAEADENIYAVIDENPTDCTSSAANTSVPKGSGVSNRNINSGGKGLLDEIVNEMQARNLTSIRKPDDQLYVNSGSGESSSEYLKPIKSSTHPKPSSSSLTNTNSNLSPVPKLSVPEKSAPGYRPFNVSKKPTPPIFKPATNSSQSSSVSAAISKYNDASSKSRSPADKGKPTVATKSANINEVKEPFKSAKTSHVASIHKKFEAQSKFVPPKRGTTS